MIKGTMTVTGTVKKAAEMKTDKNNNPFVGLVVGFNVKDAADDSDFPVEVYVMVKDGSIELVNKFVKDTRVIAKGVVDMSENEYGTKIFLDADEITVHKASEFKPGLSGGLQFRGYIQKSKELEVRTASNGTLFIAFSAYSSYKIGENNYRFLWVDFRRFAEQKQTFEDIKPEWLAPGAHICATGSFELSAYKQKLKIKSIINTIEEYVQPAQ